MDQWVGLGCHADVVTAGEITYAGTCLGQDEPLLLTTCQSLINHYVFLYHLVLLLRCCALCAFESGYQPISVIKHTSVCDFRSRFRSRGVVQVKEFSGVAQMWRPLRIDPWPRNALCARCTLQPTNSTAKYSEHMPYTSMEHQSDIHSGLNDFSNQLKISEIQLEILKTDFLLFNSISDINDLITDISKWVQFLISEIGDNWYHLIEFLVSLNLIIYITNSNFLYLLLEFLISLIRLDVINNTINDIKHRLSHINNRISDILKSNYWYQ